MTIANYIYIAAISGCYLESDWQKWADEEILNNNEVEEWVCNVSVAKNIDELCLALYDKIIEECYNDYNIYSQEDVIVGYYYMLYSEKRMSLYELISRLSDEDDESDGSSIHENQNFYVIFKYIKDNDDLMEDYELIKKIDK